MKIILGVTEKTTSLFKTHFTKKVSRMDKDSTTIFNPDVECDSEIDAFTLQPVLD